MRLLLAAAAGCCCWLLLWSAPQSLVVYWRALQGLRAIRISNVSLERSAERSFRALFSSALFERSFRALDNGGLRGALFAAPVSSYREKKAKQKLFVFALLGGRLARNGDSRGSVGLQESVSERPPMVWTDFGACRRIRSIEEGSKRKLVILV